MQINSQHLRKKALDLEQLFEPCYNIKTGTKILAEFYYLIEETITRAGRYYSLKSLSSYNTGTPYNGKSYVSKILRKPDTRALKTIRQRFNGSQICQLYDPYGMRIFQEGVYAVTGTTAKYTSVTSGR